MNGLCCRMELECFCKSSVIYKKLDSRRFKYGFFTLLINARSSSYIFRYPAWIQADNQTLYTLLLLPCGCGVHLTGWSSGIRSHLLQCKHNPWYQSLQHQENLSPRSWHQWFLSCPEGPGCHILFHFCKLDLLILHKYTSDTCIPSRKVSIYLIFLPHLF